VGSTLFYERRREHKQVEFDQRRILRRENNAKIHTDEQRRLATLVRRHQREAFRIPVRFMLNGKDFPGYTHDISPEGLLVFTETSLSAGTPMTLQFSFGQNVCHLNVSGQVVFCHLAENGESLRQAIGIKFSAIREFEQKILTSAVQELEQDAIKQEKSLLNILVSTDTLALEAGDFSNFDRRKFELPVSFSTRRKEPRRKKNIPAMKERRLIENEQGPLKALKIKIAALQTPPRESIKVILGEISGIDPNTVEESTKIRSLGLDSFQMIEMLAAVETVYNISLDEGAILRVVTIRDLIDQIETCLDV